MHGGHDGGHAEDGLNYSLPKVEEPQAMTLSDRLRKRVVEPFFFACNAAAVVTEITFPSFEGDEDPAAEPWSSGLPGSFAKRFLSRVLATPSCRTGTVSTDALAQV